jgi:membrane peptidoglycan carboxypeptidase
VRALVGGRDFYDPDDPIAQFHLATQGRRQPGSAFKPFVLAAALSQGQTLNSVYGGGSGVDIPTDSGPWFVKNYNELAYPDLTLLEATVFSVNVVYARLIQVTVPGAVTELGTDSGIAVDLAPLHSVALGAQEVSPLDMAAGFATFAAQGLKVERHLVTRIDTSTGVNLYEVVPVVTEAMDSTIANDVTAALTQVVARCTGQQADIGRPVAGNTGLSRSTVTPGLSDTRRNSLQPSGWDTRRAPFRWSRL